MDLQNECVYGPVISRRLGRSLGVNLAPAGRKACNFVCAYCRYGWADPPPRGEWPRPSHVIDAVDRTLATCATVDTITIAGNGEPTLHPAFAMIADALFRVRALRAPGARLALLTNGSTLGRPDVIGSLRRFDTRCVKLDAGDATTFRRLNAPSVTLGRLLADLRSVNDVTLHSTFVRDTRGVVDNMTPSALGAWLDAVRRIRPAAVDICTAHRMPIGTSLIAAPKDVLEEIADLVRSMGIPARVFA
jgi:wyosine [tRNA(Phe)-imidazoG37] synthetase (radical SAM superfamily)